MDNEAPFETPPFTGRNILIFSDGTGQAGGLLPDETRSNVYKFYRATRCGPDTNIDPDKQLTFYDAGLGSKAAGSQIKVGWLRSIYNAVGSATGLGITANIIDCYAALIYLWRPGDRVYLFGFSRGAYTMRCLGGVLGLCGIPQHMADDQPLLRDPASTRTLATEAVKRVYRHGSGAGDDAAKHGHAGQTRFSRLREQRVALGKQFRMKYGSDTTDGTNAVPYFIGVWDTVAAVGISPPAWKMLVAGIAAFLVVLSGGVAWSRTGALDGAFALWFLGALGALAAIGYTSYIALRVKFVTGLPGYKWYETLHLTSFKMKFFDRSLNPRVRYARHALSIDEMRADFDRVPWVNDGQAPNRELNEGAWFQQYWFAGNHSDIGGSYAENESRLSDLALGWMSREAKRAGLFVNESLLALFGRPNGPQHDECRVGISLFGLRFNWREKARKMVDSATIHWSVYERVKLPSALIYDQEKPYRPALLADHKDFAAIYAKEAQVSEQPSAVV
jgi:hypothetical protein